MLCLLFPADTKLENPPQSQIIKIFNSAIFYYTVREMVIQCTAK